MASAKVTPTRLATRPLWWLQEQGCPDTEPASQAGEEPKCRGQDLGLLSGTCTGPFSVRDLEFLSCDPPVSRGSGAESALPTQLGTHFF